MEQGELIMGGRGSKSGKISTAAKSTTVQISTQKIQQSTMPKSQMRQLLGQRDTKAYISSLSDKELRTYTKAGYTKSRALDKKYRESEIKIYNLQKRINNLEPLVKRYNDAKDKNELTKARRSLTKNKKILRETIVKSKVNTQNIVKGLNEADKRGIRVWKVTNLLNSTL